MRFLSLRIQAFGPYDSAVTFPFDRLTGLFTITGDTGSGKSTIFDALTFALYGRMSSESRGAKDARCTFSPESRRTEVVLRFSHLDREYTLKRSLKGAKLLPDAELSADGVSENGEKKVTKYIEDLIGLKVEQWRMIAVLPQGEFSKLLKAEQADRAEIIKTIFNTDQYGKYVGRLKDINTKASNEKNQCRNEIASAASPIKTDNEELKEIITALPTDSAMVYRMDDVLHMLGQQNEDDRRAVSESENALKELREESERCTREYTKAEQVVKDYRELMKIEGEWDKNDLRKKEMDELEKATVRSEKAVNCVQKTEDDLEDSKKKMEGQKTAIGTMVKDREELEESQKKLSAELEAARKARDDASGLRDRKTLLTNSLGDYEKADSNRAAKADAEAKIREINVDLESDRSKKDELSGEKAANDTFISENPDMKAKILSLEHEKTTLTEKAETLSDINLKCTDFAKSIEDLAKAFSQWDAENRKYDELHGKENEIRELLVRNKYGIIALEDLQEGMPCPVCGSIHHPSPAPMPGHEVSQKELDKAMKATENQRSVADKAKSALDALGGTIDTTRRNLITDLSKIGITTEDPASSEVADRIQSAMSENVSELEKKTSELSEATRISSEVEKRASRNEKITEMIGELDSRKEMLSEQRTSFANTIAAADAVLSSLKLEFGTKAEAEKCISQIDSKLRRLDDAVTNTETKYNDVSGQLSTKIGQLTIENEHLEEYTVETEELEAAFIKACADNGFSSADDYRSCLEKPEVLEKNRKTLEDYKAETIRITTLRDSQRAKLKDVPYPDSIDELKAKSEAAGRRLDEANSSLALRRSRLEDNEKILVKLTGLKEKFDQADHHASVTDKVYRIAIGDLKGSNSMSYDAFVQEQYFQSIVTDAASRFYKLSRGTLRLFSKSAEGESLNKKNLKLWVHDLETDTDRVVDSLSGGETFMASLSLALGMSDMIQRCAGGRSIESLFIDEGFGTLDKETLSKAIQLLGEVAGTKGSVGLITHLDELVESIPKRVEVTKKGKEGSHIEVY